ncbi:hypothetical protein Tco_0193223, partial [Tanacetum coccineum]
QSENLEIPVMTTPTETNGGAKTNTPDRTPAAARPLAVLEGQDEALHWLADYFNGLKHCIGRLN